MNSPRSPIAMTEEDEKWYLDTDDVNEAWEPLDDSDPPDSPTIKTTPELGSSDTPLTERGQNQEPGLAKHALELEITQLLKLIAARNVLSRIVLSGWFPRTMNLKALIWWAYERLYRATMDLVGRSNSVNSASCKTTRDTRWWPYATPRCLSTLPNPVNLFNFELKAHVRAIALLRHWIIEALVQSRNGSNDSMSKGQGISPIYEFPAFLSIFKMSAANNNKGKERQVDIPIRERPPVIIRYCSRCGFTVPDIQGIRCQTCGYPSPIPRTDQLQN